MHIDRPLLHDLVGPDALAKLRQRKLPVHNPELVFATVDHTVSTNPDRASTDYFTNGDYIDKARTETKLARVTFFDLGNIGQGILHVIAPELGIILPGVTAVCGDSHTCTNGGLGAIAFGVGSSEMLHVLATQTLRQKKPKQMRINCVGTLGDSVSAKDLALHIIRKLGAKAGAGYAVEFSGSAVCELSIESRMTLCNMAIELGARCGIIAPDLKTLDYLRDRKYAPKTALFEKAAVSWLTLFSDSDSVFDVDLTIDATNVSPMVTWGTNPEHVIEVGQTIPDPSVVSAEFAKTFQDALDYMGLKANDRIEGLPIDWVFIGSCANSRISDLRSAAAHVQGQKVAKGVTAWIVPGSESVKREAENEGLKEIFEAAGFVWREAGCSMCVAANGERVPPGQRSVSTSNRNFVGRQGPGARTHIVSPAMAAAAAIAGFITDVRRIG